MMTVNSVFPDLIQMRVITDYFNPPGKKEKSCLENGNVQHNHTDTPQRLRKSQRKCLKEVKKEAAASASSDSDDGAYYELRKIKIRLADPSKPDSFVCEVYDSPPAVEEENLTVVQLKAESLKNGKPAKHEEKEPKTFPVERRRSIRKRRRNSRYNFEDESANDEQNEAKRLKTANGHPEKSKVCRTRSQTTEEEERLVVNKNGKSALVSKRQTRSKSKENLSNSNIPEKVVEKPLKKDKPGQRKSNKRVRTRTPGACEEKGKSPKVDKTPIKDCSVVLIKTPLKITKESPKNSPTKECSVILEKLTPETQTRIAGFDNQAKKLAPIFLKRSKNSTAKIPINSTKKETIDPKILQARKAFLQTGIPVHSRKKTETAKLPEESGNHSFFPTISHVQQRDDAPEWSYRKISLPLNNNNMVAVKHPVWKPWTITGTEPKIFPNKKTLTIAEALERFRSSHPDLIPLMETLIETRDEYKNQNQMPIWSEKYKVDSRNIISNERVVCKLKKWLKSWKLYGEELRDGVRRREHREDCNSSDDFMSSDDEKKLPTAPVTACLISGPVGCGKTALVHTLASEMDFHVLEVNASSKRSGKKMLSDLQEATQSHKILQETSGSVSQSADKMAVIVVEDADIVFEEHDEGFVAGLQNLISLAKRPVILLTSDISVPHLEKFRTCQTLQLTMIKPQIAKACAFLELVCLVEGVVPSRTSLFSLLQKNGQDLRRCLHDLQFWLEDNGDCENAWKEMIKVPVTSSKLWWSSHHKGGLWHSTTQESKVKKVLEERHKEMLKSFVTYAENMSSYDILARKTDENCGLNRWSFHVKDSSALSENLSSEGIKQTSLRLTVEGDIKERIGEEFKQQTQDLSVLQEESRWFTTQKKAQKELTEVIPTMVSSLDRNCDYLPALRTICRSEKERLATNTKRRNRFYHYLRTLGMTPTQSNLDTNCLILSAGRSEQRS